MEESTSAAAGDQRDESTEQEVTIRERDMDQTSTCTETEPDAFGLDGSESKSPLNKSDILKAVEVVKRDSRAIAYSFSSLFASLRFNLSEVSIITQLIICVALVMQPDAFKNLKNSEEECRCLGHGCEQACTTSMTREDEPAQIKKSVVFVLCVCVGPVFTQKYWNA
ncbi:hypothetical protein REPUB_Repub08aG0180700 [Reevesia pubescens]